MKLTILCLLLILPVSFSCYAELYKWVDKNGKTHYSDKNPNIGNEEVIQTEQKQSSNTYKNAAIKKPILRPYESVSRKILLTEVTYIWKRRAEINKSRKVGSYYLGNYCTPRGPINLPDAYVYHSNFFPSETSLPRNIKLTIKSFGYDAEVSTPYGLLKKLEETNGVKLDAEIIEIDLHSCAPMYKPASVVSARKVKDHLFKKNRVYLKVKWGVRQNRNQQLIYETVTSGYYDAWYKVMTVQDAISKAVELATVNLFADDAFIGKIMTKEKQTTTALKKSPQTEPGFWSKVIPSILIDSGQSIQKTLSGQYVVKAKIASVFSEINAIKMNSIQYYLENDYWPRKIEEIGLNDIMFSNHKYISDVTLDSDGTISVDLKEDAFGSNKVLQLTPDSKAFKNSKTMNIKWHCYSNMEAALMPMSCEKI